MRTPGTRQRCAGSLVLALTLAACARESAPAPALAASTASPASAPSGQVAAPSGLASAAPPDPSACVQAVADHERAVHGHADAARVKMGARDGAGCLAELDAYDQLDPWSGGPSTDPKSTMAIMRGMCLMLAGRCNEGKALYRSAMQIAGGATMGSEMLERSVDTIASLYCQGTALAPRDELLRALMDLNQGAYMTTKTPAACRAAYDASVRLIPKVPPSGDDDTMIKQAKDIVRVAAPACFARAGDCATAWRVFRDEWHRDNPQLDEPTLRKTFASMTKCQAP